MTRRRKPGNPKTAIGYIRASTGDQRLSVEAQRTELDAWARRHGVRVASWHVDQGVSGTAPLDARPGLLGALAALRDEGAGQLLVLRRDRLARDTYVAMTIERAVERDGARVVAADGQGNGDQPGEVMVRRIQDAVSEHERALIAARTKAALAAKRARGERAGEVPYGYALDPNDPTRQRIIEEPAEQHVILFVTSWREGGKTIREIAAELARLKFTGRTGKPLSHTQVHRIIVRENNRIKAA